MKTVTGTIVALFIAYIASLGMVIHAESLELKPREATKLQNNQQSVTLSYHGSVYVISSQNNKCSPSKDMLCVPMKDCNNNIQTSLPQSSINTLENLRSGKWLEKNKKGKPFPNELEEVKKAIDVMYSLLINGCVVPVDNSSTGLNQSHLEN